MPWSLSPVLIASPAAAPPERVSIFEVANVVLRHWRLVVVTPILFAIASAIIVMVVHPKYIAMAAFAPENKKSGLNLTGVASLASDLGVALPGMDNSVRFYGDVLASRGIRDSVLLSLYRDPRSPDSTSKATLLDILDIKGKTQAERLDLGRQMLKSIVTIAVNGGSNIVGVSVKTRYPTLSADIANRHVDLLNEFNYKSRETSGRYRREFAQARVAQTEQELESAEQAEAQFIARNRHYEQSPELSFEYRRLHRDVQVKELILSTMRKDLEDARIQEVNDTPLITIIDRATPPGKRSSPRRTLTVVISTVLGGLVGLLLAFGADYFERARASDAAEYQEAAGRLHEIRSRFKGLKPSRSR